MANLKKMIKHYGKYQLNESELTHDPFKLFADWMNDAIKKELSEPNAMTVATVDKQGCPSARIMLLKEFSPYGFVFFTNYNSRKGQELNENSNVALVFWWPVCERQVRIEGCVKKISPEDSDEYFAGRSLDSRLGALASKQSSILQNRDELFNLYHQLQEKYKGSDLIPRPEYWGGYITKPRAIEFWQGGPHRLHDRIRYELSKSGDWQFARLAP